MRAAFVRDKYPDTMYAGYASSAPVEASVDQSFYFEPVYRGMNRYGFGNCTQDIKAAIKYIDHTFDTDRSASAKLKEQFLGKGAAYAQADEAVRNLVERSGIPYVPMSMAKGLLPDTHPLSAGAARSLALKEADVVMLVGARLNWLLSHGKGKPPEQKPWTRPGQGMDDD